LSSLWSAGLDWGIKYGLGSSSLHGDDKNYELRYDIYEHAATTTDLGYLRLRAQKNEGGISQNAGVYASLMLTRKVDSVSLHTELLWQRYAFSHKFQGAPLSTNNLLLASTFADTLKGRIDRTVDYITLPIMIRLNQELSEEKKQNNYQGAFVYLGPSFSVKLDQNNNSHNGIKALEQDVDNFVQDSLSDADNSSYYSSTRQNSGSDKLTAFKTDLVIGTGFTLKDIFNFGIGKDEFVFDFRFTMGINDLGDNSVRNAITLRSIMFSIGSRL
jgi:hypothetical protein